MKINAKIMTFGFLLVLLLGVSCVSAADSASDINHIESSSDVQTIDNDNAVFINSYLSQGSYKDLLIGPFMSDQGSYKDLQIGPYTQG